MAVSVDEEPELAKAREKSQAAFAFLSDPDGTLMDRFGLRNEGQHPTGGDVARNAWILLDPKGEILWTHATDNYRMRPNPEEVIEVARKLLPKQP